MVFKPEGKGLPKHGDYHGKGMIFKPKERTKVVFKPKEKKSGV